MLYKATPLTRKQKYKSSKVLNSITPKATENNVSDPQPLHKVFNVENNFKPLIEPSTSMLSTVTEKNKATPLTRKQKYETASEV